jgi:Na+/proline symporter
VNAGFTVLDAIVIVAYLAGTTALGIWVGRRQAARRTTSSPDARFPGGPCSSPIVATETSALTFISIPGLAYTGNLGFLEVVAGYVLGRIGVAVLLLPRYYEGEIVTAYTLLEKRFGLATRRLTSIVFMVTRGMADSVRVFATAIPLALILGDRVPRAWQCLPRSWCWAG